MEDTGAGFKNLLYTIAILFFADDGLILSQSIKQAENNIRKVINVSNSCGLDINKDKSQIIIFNMENKPESIENIKVSEKIKYLGITINDSKTCFKIQKEETLKKARKLANQTYSIIHKSCNKQLIGKTYWKCIALPSILYGSNIIQMSDKEIDQLQTLENSVYRQILGAPKYASNCTLRGEIGSSTMKKRIMEGKLTYMKNIMERDNQLLNNVLQTMKLEGYKSWMKTTIIYLSVLNLTPKDIEELSIKQIKAKLKEWDNQEWEKEIASKVSLSIYSAWKGTIGGKDI